MEPSHSSKCHCSQDVEVSVADKGTNAKLLGFLFCRLCKILAVDDLLEFYISCDSDEEHVLHNLTTDNSHRPDEGKFRFHRLQIVVPSKIVVIVHFYFLAISSDWNSNWLGGEFTSKLI